MAYIGLYVSITKQQLPFVRKLTYLKSEEIIIFDASLIIVCIERTKTDIH